MILKKWNYKHHEDSENQEKVFESCHTTTPSEFKKSVGRKFFGLTNCPSYKSYKASDSQTSNNNHLKLISKYLLAIKQQQKQLLFHEMKVQYNNAKNEQKCMDLKLNKLYQKEQDQVFEYFVGVYLNFMGYGQQSNKKYVLSRVKMHIGMESIKLASFLYQNLFKNILPNQTRKQQLLNICKKGWEYFIKLLLKILAHQRQIVHKHYTLECILSSN